MLHSESDSLKVGAVFDNRRSATVKNKQKGFIKEYQTQNQTYCHHKLFCLGERFDEMEIV